ncbi:PliI family lysozyme inhibitor of I-type lysozyme [Shewanella olleyana]|uniref:PliI family lysozyme inhibitor of I-type lysozyme n=1 Tax=Shewanella olleyana TaxID=135626 RepID=UPI00200CD793|nr:PliI family lysozyme inhibitor of I-type lysozyme [Shewanella olleyana]MCL1067977.1 PliI family lysozyme inhibitor of I-type lysozyme [Shewanella olleyana]
MKILLKTITVIAIMLSSISVQSHEGYELTTSNGGTYIKAFNFDNGQSVVIAEGRIEPRSIGSISIKLYKDLNVGDFTQGIIIPRDGTILSVAIVEDTAAKQKLKITTVTAGSGNYQDDVFICVSDNLVSKCG